MTTLLSFHGKSTLLPITLCVTNPEVLSKSYFTSYSKLAITVFVYAILYLTITVIPSYCHLIFYVTCICLLPVIQQYLSVQMPWGGNPCPMTTSITKETGNKNKSKQGRSGGPRRPSFCINLEGALLQPHWLILSITSSQ